MLSAIAIIVGIITFTIKLNKDSVVAAYRETIAYMDTHNKELDENWEKIKLNEGDEKTIKLFLNRLEQMALLVNKRAFDNDLVYSSYWELYSEPLKNIKVLDFYNHSRSNDQEVYKEYKILSEKWAAKIYTEQNNGANLNNS